MSKQIITSCQKCCFAEYRNDTQYGCAARQLDLFDKIEAYNEEGKFYIIPGVCLFHRTHKWLKDLSVKKGFKKAVSELTIKYNAIIYGVNHTLEEIVETIKSVAQQEIQPDKLVVAVRGMSEQDQVVLVHELCSRIKLWQMESLVEEESLQGYIERSAYHHQNMWILSLEAGQTIQKDWIKIVNNAFLFQKDDFWAASPLDDDFLRNVLYMKNVYTLWGGNFHNNHPVFKG